MEEFLARVFENLGGRVGGPMTARLLLQPTIAALLAIKAGLADARAGRPAYFWAMLHEPEHRASLLREGWQAVMKVFIMAVLIDAIYQWVALRWFYPGEALIVAFVLAIVPYMLIRGPVNLLVRRRPR